MIDEQESNARTIALALWLTAPLISDSLPAREALRVRLREAGVLDDAVAARHAEMIVEQEPPLLDAIDALSEAMLDLVHGLPVLRNTPFARRLARIIDPDALITLHAKINLPDEERFDWGAVPLVEGGRCVGILEDSSVDTHIHLGGALPPLFYWIIVIGGELPFEVMRRLGARDTREQADRWVWYGARAALLRLQLAAKTIELGRLAGLEIPRAIVDNVDELLSAADMEVTGAFVCPDASPEIRRRVLGLTHDWRAARGRHDWPFADPLRSASVNARKPHYAEGERRMLYLLGRLMRHPDPGRRQEIARLEPALLWYLRIRNAFHRCLVHDAGSDGLLRFGETFSKRSLIKDRRTRRKVRRRRRARRHALDLERCRMCAALDAQLVLPFLKTSAYDADPPTRGIEMRVALSDGPSLLPTIRAWLEGIDLHSNSTRPNEAARRSRVALLIHLKKKKLPDGKDEAAALSSMRTLAELLMERPGLRPYIVGIDAAGPERASTPRTFARAFARMRELVREHRARASDPEIRLGVTFHVGEDVIDMMTGLRHVDEVVNLLLPRREGGRLGHALVLAENPRRFYTRRGGETEPLLGAHLLDLAWAWGRLAETADVSDRQWIEHRVGQLSPGSGRDEIRCCFQAMGLSDGRDRQEWPATEQELIAELLQGTKEPGLDPDRRITLVPDERWLQVTERLQQMLLHKLCCSRLCIEANPTSNLIIGGYTSFAELPCLKLVEHGLAVSLNTDDPGLFMTTMPGEYMAMYHALPGASHRERLRWLAGRAFDAQKSTFLGHHVPAGQRPVGWIDQVLEPDPDIDGVVLVKELFCD